MASSWFFFLIRLHITIWIAFSQKYIFVPQIKTVNEAETYCSTAYGTTLASVHSAADNEEAYQLCSSHPKCVHGPKCQAACSIGAKYDRDDAWSWSDRSEFNYGNWFPFQSSSFDNACAVMLAKNHPLYLYGGSWSSSPCDGNSEQRFLCNAPSDTTVTPITTTTYNPSMEPTVAPTDVITSNPTKTPTVFPTNTPTIFPTLVPTHNPSNIPTHTVTKSPSNNPTNVPTTFPSANPTNNPTKTPTIIPTQVTTTKQSNVSSTAQTAVTVDSAVYPSLKLEVEYDFRSTLQQKAMIYAADDNSSDSSDSIEMTTVYIAGGASGALMFLLLCICALFAICLIRFWRRRQNHDVLKKGYSESDNDASVEKYDKRHHYHHSVQLTESVFNTINIENDEGEEPRTDVSISMNEEEELLAMAMNINTFSESDDKEFDEMYEQSGDSTQLTPTKQTNSSKGDYQSVEESVTKIKIDRKCIRTYTQRTVAEEADTDEESDSVLLGNMYQQPIPARHATKK